VKIINRYVLKEHVGPFVFALSALTSLLLLQYIARKFGDLVGKGLSWQTITEFFLLSIPFTLAMTLPMAVLVAVLYAFSRLASENEITAMKAGGVSSRSLLKPALAAGTALAIFMLWFNDQLLSRANHELATLQVAILRTKPTFALKPQIVNAVKEGQSYLAADQINQDESGRMHGIRIYDVSEPSRRKTIYADSGTLQFAPNKKDLVLHLYNGVMMTAPTQQHGQLERIYYREAEQKIRDVANSFTPQNADSTSKGEREMTVCEMQSELEARQAGFQRAYYDSVMAASRLAAAKGKKSIKPADLHLTKAGGIGALYCSFITKYLHVPAAQAAEVPGALQQDSTRKVPHARAAQRTDSVSAIVNGVMKRYPRDKVPAGAYLPETAAHVPVPSNPTRTTATPPVRVSPVPPPAPSVVPPPGAPVPPAGQFNTADPQPPADATAYSIELSDAKVRLDDARHWTNRYGVEIQKKFSLAFACIVFVLVGAPIALRFPRGGVGLVMGVGFAVFAIYYVGLIGGESLANNNVISPFWAMWIDNIVFLSVGLALISRMGHERGTTRGGGFGEVMDATRAWFARMRGAEVGA
jgi:lipopolysaccharide export system permease protein